MTFDELWNKMWERLPDLSIAKNYEGSDTLVFAAPYILFTHEAGIIPGWVRERGQINNADINVISAREALTPSGPFFPVGVKKDGRYRTLYGWYKDDLHPDRRQRLKEHRDVESLWFSDTRLEDLPPYNAIPTPPPVLIGQT